MAGTRWVHFKYEISLFCCLCDWFVLVCVCRSHHCVTGVHICLLSVGLRSLLAEIKNRPIIIGITLNEHKDFICLFFLDQSHLKLWKHCNSLWFRRWGYDSKTSCMTDGPASVVWRVSFCFRLMRLHFSSCQLWDLIIFLSVLFLWCGFMSQSVTETAQTHRTADTRDDSNICQCHKKQNDQCLMFLFAFSNTLTRHFNNIFKCNIAH